MILAHFNAVWFQTHVNSNDQIYDNVGYMWHHLAIQSTTWFFSYKIKCLHLSVHILKHQTNLHNFSTFQCHIVQNMSVSIIFNCLIQAEPHGKRQ